MFVVAEIIGAVCLFTAALDMGMNGSRGAGWAPFGIVITAICGVVMWLTYPQG